MQKENILYMHYVLKDTTYVAITLIFFFLEFRAVIV